MMAEESKSTEAGAHCITAVAIMAFLANIDDKYWIGQRRSH